MAFGNFALPALHEITQDTDEADQTYRSVNVNVYAEQRCSPRTTSVGAGTKEFNRTTGRVLPAVHKLFPLQRTHFRAEMSAVAVWSRIGSMLRNNRVEVVERANSEYECSILVRHGLLSFNVCLYQDGPAVVVEFRRRKGCGCVFAHTYRIFSRAFLGGNVGGDAIAGALVALVEAALCPPMPMQPLALPQGLVAASASSCITELEPALEPAVASSLAGLLSDPCQEVVREGSSALAALAADGVPLLASEELAMALGVLLSSADLSTRATATEAVASLAESYGALDERQRRCLAASLQKLLENIAYPLCCHTRREAARALACLSSSLREELRRLDGATVLRAARCGTNDPDFQRFTDAAVRNIEAF